MTLTPGGPWSCSTRRSSRPTPPARGRQGPRQPELLPPRRPPADRERRDRRQVRHRRIPDPRRLRLPGGGHQPDVVPAEAQRAGADSPRRDAGPQRPGRRRRVHVDLEPYHTQTVDYYFYFPAPGEFAHFPVHVAKNEKLIAAAEPFTFNVVDKPTKIDTGSWDYISQIRHDDDVLAFLNEQNSQLNLDKIALRMKDKEAFHDVIRSSRPGTSTSTRCGPIRCCTTSFPRRTEFLEHAENVVNEAGGYLVSTLLTIDPVERTHVRAPGIQAAGQRPRSRPGRTPADRQRAFLWQYHRLLHDLSYMRTLKDEDLLAVTYYLLLQDRVEESLKSTTRTARASTTAAPTARSASSTPASRPTTKTSIRMPRPRDRTPASRPRKTRSKVRSASPSSTTCSSTCRASRSSSMPWAVSTSM